MWLAGKSNSNQWLKREKRKEKRENKNIQIKTNFILYTAEPALDYFDDATVFLSNSFRQFSNQIEKSLAGAQISRANLSVYPGQSRKKHAKLINLSGYNCASQMQLVNVRM